MSEPERDWDLLRAYVEAGSEDAFSRLVERHVNMVYSACLRQVRDPHLAEDAAQATFLVLARKAHRLHEGVVLSSWLYRVARFSAKNALKMEHRRRMHERKAAEMAIKSTIYEPTWHQLEPLLDDAVGSLSQRDRTAVILRFFEQRSFKEVAQALGASEAAAEMRVSRAMEKLRAFFRRRGIILPALMLSSFLLSNSVSAAPQWLGGSAAKLVTAPAAVGTQAGAIQVLAQRIVRDMAWATGKLVALGCIGVAIGAALTFYLVQHVLLREPAGPPREKFEHAMLSVVYQNVENMRPGSYAFELRRALANG